jgi:hypothetical protein
MSRALLALLLFAAGLGLGLWLGFNPERRAAVESSWEEASSSIARVEAEVGLSPAATTEPTPEAENAEQQGTSPLAPLARVIEDFWRATQQLWFSLLARVELS